MVLSGGFHGWCARTFQLIILKIKEIFLSVWGRDPKWKVCGRGIPVMQPHYPSPYLGRGNKAPQNLTIAQRLHPGFGRSAIFVSTLVCYK